MSQTEAPSRDLSVWCWHCKRIKTVSLIRSREPVMGAPEARKITALLDCVHRVTFVGPYWWDGVFEAAS